EPEPAPTDADGTPEDPEQLAADAQLAFAEGRFEDVVRLAARAHALTGDPRHLYAQALAERRLGHCREALVLYARVLASVRDDPAYAALVDGTRQGIALCHEALEQSEAAEAPPASPSTPPPAATDERPAPRTEPPRRWYRDPWGGVLLGLGVVVTATGGPLWVLSNGARDRAENAQDEAAYAESLARARGLRTGAVASLAVGGALLTGAILRYGLVARDLRRSMAGLVPLPSGLALGWRGVF
ncbi:MAG: hypothetical protein KDK70_25860, partial [Myxococcales bacterium]|nr:hypothetical protein [Myxococcales bacterium]